MTLRKKVIIAVCSVLVIAAVVVGLFPTWYHLFTGRDTFYTKKAMLEYLEGEWEIIRTTVVSHNTPSITDLNESIKKIEDYEWMDWFGYELLFIVEDNNQLLVSDQYNNFYSISPNNLHHQLGYVGSIDHEIASPLDGIYITHDNTLYSFVYDSNNLILRIDEFCRIRSQQYRDKQCNSYLHTSKE